MNADNYLLTTHEVHDIMLENEIPIPVFIKAVKSGKINPYWSDGSKVDIEELEALMNELEQTRKTIK